MLRVLLASPLEVVPALLDVFFDIRWPLPKALSWLVVACDLPALYVSLHLSIQVVSDQYNDERQASR